MTVSPNLYARVFEVFLIFEQILYDPLMNYEVAWLKDFFYNRKWKRLFVCTPEIIYDLVDPFFINKFPNLMKENLAIYNNNDIKLFIH